jgi:uncharacterized membrane protein
MSKTQTHLLAAVYPDREHARTILDTLEMMKRAENIHVVDQALVMNEEGKLKVEETEDLSTKKGAKRGALILGAFGLIFPPSFIASVLVGGGAGALAGKLKDTGVKTDELEKLAKELVPPQAMVVVLAEEDSIARVQNTLGAYEGKLVITVFDEETMRQINLEQETLNASVHDGTITSL